MNSDFFHNNVTQENDLNNIIWMDSRPLITEADKLIIHDLLEILPGFSKMLVAGEVLMQELGDEVSIKLLAVNGCPELQDQQVLFITTDRNTIRMTRWDGHIVWSMLPSALKHTIFAEEARRLGLKKWTEEFPDFYQGAIFANGLYDKYMRANNNPMIRNYLNSALLFYKAWTYDIPPSAFFCQFSFKDVGLFDLTKKQKEERASCFRPKIKRLTNDELFYLSELVETSCKIIPFRRHCESYK